MVGEASAEFMMIDISKPVYLIKIQRDPKACKALTLILNYIKYFEPPAQQVIVTPQTFDLFLKKLPFEIQKCIKNTLYYKGIALVKSY